MDEAATKEELRPVKKQLVSPCSTASSRSRKDLSSVEQAGMS